MDWTEKVKEKMKRKNQILFSKDCDFLRDLVTLMDEQSHQTMVLWAFEFAEEAVKTLEEKYPNEQRPRTALETSKLWAAGSVKMPAAQRAILNCHALTREMTSREDIALCHAVGQACGTVHTSGHAIGFPIYELTSIVRKFGVEHCKEPVENRKQHYLDRIVYWKNHVRDYPGTWADFLRG